tara:strand:+ start:57 stop:881 length:825 start_codon:yes stop_codon:yes gene_type:complete
LDNNHYISGKNFRLDLLKYLGLLGRKKQFLCYNPATAKRRSPASFREKILKFDKFINPITVVYMGDSITEGQYVDYQYRWTELVSRSLRDEFSDVISSDAIYFFNRGISNETTRQGLERFPRDVQVLKPTIITLQFGLNDCNCWDTDKGLPRVSERAYEANLVEMIARARVFGAEKIILSTNHPTLRHSVLASGTTLEDRRKEYNNIVRQVAAEEEVTLCDMESVFEGIRDLSLSEMLLPEPDVLHLSIEGHKTYAAAIFEKLKKAIDLIVSEK